MYKVFIKESVTWLLIHTMYNLFYKVLLEWTLRISPVLTEYCKRLWKWVTDTSLIALYIYTH